MSSYKNINILLKEEMERFKNNFFKNQKELENHQSVAHKQFLFLQKEEERILKNNEIFLKSESGKIAGMNGIALLFLYLDLVQKSKFAKNEQERFKYLQKLQEINDNFEQYKKIEQGFHFVKDKELLVNKLMNFEKTFEEIFYESGKLLENLNTSKKNVERLIDTSEFSKKTIALLVAENFDQNFGLDKDNVIFVKDYLNFEFDTNVSIQDLACVKNQLNKRKEKNKEEERELA